MDTIYYNSTENPITIGEQLQRLSTYNNRDQLTILKSEIDYIIVNNIQPYEEWFISRYTYIQLYSRMGWSQFMARFEDKDTYICNIIIKIIRLYTILIDEYSTKPRYDLYTYYRLICEINTLCNYYFDKYEAYNNEQYDELSELMGGIGI